MTSTPSRPLLLRIALIAILLPAGACARSGIDDEVDLDAGSLSDDEASVEELDAQEPDAEEKDAEIPDIDAAPPPLYDGGPDAGEPQHDADVMDAAHDAGDSGEADAGAHEAGPAMDASAPDAAAADAAVDAAPDAAPPIDAGPTCTTGTYKGKFDGTVSVSFFGFLIAIAGDVSVVLAPGSSAGHLALQNGRITGTDDSGSPVSADITGELNCATGMIENGKLENGKYESLFLVTFEGVVDGKYSYLPPGANGTWMTTQGSTQLLMGGHGTWSVTLSQ
jgi:hypothetical protein